MKKSILLWSLILIAGVMPSCTNRGPEDKEYFVVNPELSNRKTAEVLRQNTEYKLMEFQTPDSIVFSASASTIVPGDNHFFVYDYQQNQFLIFDRDGKFIQTFSRKGQGPEEYTAMLDFTIDDSQLYILDFTKLKIYDLKGNFLRDFDVVAGRGEIAVGGNHDIYLRRGYHNETQLQIFSPDGTLIANLLPSREVLHGFEIPTNPSGAIGRIGKDIYIAPPFQNSVFSIADTVPVAIATFDFCDDNIPDNFFEGDTGQVEERFHNRRDHQNGFVYMENLFISSNWIVFCPTWSPDKRLVLADRTTGTTYTDKDLPEILCKFFGHSIYFDGYDPSSDSFIRLLGIDRVLEALEEIEEDNPGALSDIKANVELSNLTENNNEFLLFVKFK